jgi:hypothetical protein
VQTLTANPFLADPNRRSKGNPDIDSVPKKALLRGKEKFLSGGSCMADLSQKIAKEVHSDKIFKTQKHVRRLCERFNTTKFER